MILMHQLYGYKKALESGNESNIEEAKAGVDKTVSRLDMTLDVMILGLILEELLTYSTGEYMTDFLKGTSSREKAGMILSSSDVARGRDLPIDIKSYNKSKDPLLEASELLVPRYYDALIKSRELNDENSILEQRIINSQFAITGATSPPDATFSLRIADGLVKGYDYNGTKAPFQTTFFGMYDRHFANKGEAPWSLPERWLNPPMELLRSPLNFVSTFDTIGGNSGSPVINKNREVVGLNFDSNIERLPVRSIMYDPQFGRSIGVHMGGVYAALKYIYKADSLLGELGVGE